MLFEGSEKKFELVVRNFNLIPWARQHAPALVQACGAQILSQLNNEKLQSYLLSESSLFVWPDRLLMISCGKTQLAKSVAYALQNLPSIVECLLFERKNEFFPTYQLTDFKSDVQIIEPELRKHRHQGQAWHFGYTDEHHLQLYHSQKAYTPRKDEHTLELLMYHMPLDRLPQKSDKKFSHTLFEGFEISEHFFEPQGYSLNALRGSEYYTLHVSPEANNPYVSFETNLSQPAAVAQQVLKIFAPQSFDLIYFSPLKKNKMQAIDFQPEGFQARTRFAQNLDCGFNIQYEHWFQPFSTPRQGRRL